MFEFLQSNRKRIWAFSNENVNAFCEDIDFNDKSIIGIGGGGDQALSFLSRGALKYQAFDRREKAVDFLRIKKAMVINLDYEEFIDAFKNKTKTKKVLKKIENYISGDKEILWLEELNQDKNFVSALKETNFFYNHSFGNLKYKNYFPYLKRKEYRRLQGNISGLKIKRGSLEKEFGKLEDKYDFIYLSNILDSALLRGIYLKGINKTLDSCKKNLKLNGQLLIATLIEKKIEGKLKQKGYEVSEISSPSKFVRPWLYIIRRYPYVLLTASLKKG